MHIQIHYTYWQCLLSAVLVRVGCPWDSGYHMVVLRYYGTPMPLAAIFDPRNDESAGEFTSECSKIPPSCVDAPKSPEVARGIRVSGHFVTGRIRRWSLSLTSPPYRWRLISGVIWLPRLVSARNYAVQKGYFPFHKDVESRVVKCCLHTAETYWAVESISHSGYRDSRRTSSW